jgi:hypothetical protein
MRPAPFAIGAVVVAVAVCGCGGGSGKSSGTSSGTSSGPAATGGTTSSSGARSTASALPPGTPAALRGVHGGVLRGGELQGFVPRGHPTVSTGVHSWVAKEPPELRASEAAGLEALGFVAGLGELLAPTPSSGATGEAISLVEQFRTAHGASGEVADQLKRALAAGAEAFAVAGIPGARGFGSSTNAGSGPNANVAFAVGRYYYIVAFGGGSTGAPTRAQLTAAAQRLYGRVRG